MQLSPELLVFIRGLMIGLSIAAPVGPIGVLCIRRTLAAGRMSGLVSGLGAASADAIYGCVAAFGLTFISGFLVNQGDWLRMVGGLFLVYLGLKTFLAEPSQKPNASIDNGFLGAYLSTFFLTLTNPMTILSFAAIFAGVGIASPSGGYLQAGLMVLGVFLGSACWWFLLSGSVSLLRHRFDLRALRWVNRLAGLVLVAFGLLALISLFI